MKKNLYIILAAVLWVAEAPAIAGAQAVIDAKALEEHVEFLSDTLLQGRGRRSPGHEDAAFYIARHFERIGLKQFGGSYSMAFSVSDSLGIGHNIIGIRPAGGQASAARSSRYIIVGAHYDGIGTLDSLVYPGADANASGVAMMMEIARALKTQKANVIFVAFDSFYDGREGSRALLSALRKGTLKDPVTGRGILLSQVALMVDIDQAGSTRAPVHKARKDYLLALGCNSLPQSRRTLLQQCNSTLYHDVAIPSPQAGAYPGPGLDLCYDYYGSDRFTKAFYHLGDRRCFIDAGIPALYFTSGITSITNSWRDAPATLDYPVMRLRASLILTLLERY